MTTRTLSYRALHSSLLLIALLTIAGSCSRKAGGGYKEITITGRVLRDCSGIPLVAQRLEFYLKSHNAVIGGESGAIGSATTDANGHFSVTGRNYGAGGLNINLTTPDSGRSRLVYEYEIWGKDGAVVDIGTIYLRVGTSQALKFSRSSNSPRDTLYYGMNASPYGSVVGADIDGHVYYKAMQTAGESLPYVHTDQWVWGIGMAQYNKALDSLKAVRNTQSPKYYNVINMRNGVCADDTVRVNL